ncbi:MAG: hypothetical protein RMK89_09565 [Armatimonadota bacterium]|nr:hypothetical protein [Armatimonadota bacterium]MDW8143695.1 hypothetical protein [Armatimonadota bacterium]
MKFRCLKTALKKFISDCGLKPAAWLGKLVTNDICGKEGKPLFDLLRELCYNGNWQIAFLIPTQGGFEPCGANGNLIG